MNQIFVSSKLQSSINCSLCKTVTKYIIKSGRVHVKSPFNRSHVLVIRDADIKAVSKQSLSQLSLRRHFPSRSGNVVFPVFERTY